MIELTKGWTSSVRAVADIGGTQPTGDAEGEWVMDADNAHMINTRTQKRIQIPQRPFGSGNSTWGRGVAGRGQVNPKPNLNVSASFGGKCYVCDQEGHRGAHCQETRRRRGIISPSDTRNGKGQGRGGCQGQSGTPCRA